MFPGDTTKKRPFSTAFKTPKKATVAEGEEVAEVAVEVELEVPMEVSPSELIAPTSLVDANGERFTSKEAYLAALKIKRPDMNWNASQGKSLWDKYKRAPKVHERKKVNARKGNEERKAAGDMTLQGRYFRMHKRKVLLIRDQELAQELANGYYSGIRTEIQQEFGRIQHLARNDVLISNIQSCYQTIAKKSISKKKEKELAEGLLKQQIIQSAAQAKPVGPPVQVKGPSRPAIFPPFKFDHSQVKRVPSSSTNAPGPSRQVPESSFVPLVEEDDEEEIDFADDETHFESFPQFISNEIVDDVIEIEDDPNRDEVVDLALADCIYSLEPKNWVNDLAILQGLRLICTEKTTLDTPSVYLNPVFSLNIFQKKEKDFTRWLSSFDFASKRYIFIPFCNPEVKHWVLFVVDKNEKRVFLLDSWRESKEKAEFGKVLLQNIIQFYPKGEEVFGPSSMYLALKPEVSKQDNLYDCGVFVIAFAWAIKTKKPLKAPIDGEFWRESIKKSIHDDAIFF